MNDDQLLRYSRHILLDEIGIEGQQRLLDAHVLVIGAGGLGSPALLYLASAGVGRITVVDNDTVDLTNLQRQIAHTQARVGQAKAPSAREAMQAINPEPTIDVVCERADAAALDRLVAQADVVLDCTDNFRTRQAINQACVTHGKPLVAGAAIGFSGQISTYLPGQPDSPCYACVFPPSQHVEDVACATMGVLAPLVGLIGVLEAQEALKLLIGTGESLCGRLLLVDGLRSRFDEIKVKRHRDCPVCRDRP